MAGPQLIPRLIETLIQGRLLLVEEETDAGGRAVVTLAHEALIEEWPAAKNWLDRNRASMQRIGRLLLSLAAPEPKDRRYAVGALAEIGSAATEAVPAVIAALRDTDEVVRAGAAAALGKIGPAAAETVPALIAALGDADKMVRRSAAGTLEHIGPPAAEAVPALLVTALADFDTDVCQSAAEAIGQAVMPALALAVQSVDWGLRTSPTEALKVIGSAGVPSLIAALGAASNTDLRRFLDASVGSISAT
jgi:HEAT repeat protein